MFDYFDECNYYYIVILLLYCYIVVIVFMVLFLMICNYTRNNIHCSQLLKQ